MLYAMLIHLSRFFMDAMKTITSTSFFIQILWLQDSFSCLVWNMTFFTETIFEYHENWKFYTNHRGILSKSCQLNEENVRTIYKFLKQM